MSAVPIDSFDRAVAGFNVVVDHRSAQRGDGIVVNSLPPATGKTVRGWHGCGFERRPPEQRAVFVAHICLTTSATIGHWLPLVSPSAIDPTL